MQLLLPPFDRIFCQKSMIPERLKIFSLMKNLHFSSDQADIQPISRSHESSILTQFHDLRVKIIDFLVITK